MAIKTLTIGGVQKGAAFSPCRMYRYALLRAWDTKKTWCAFIGLNPSTADQSQDDPTTRRCMAFARRLGCGGLYLVNLFAYRTTQPDRLLHLDDPIGKDNDKWILSVTQACKPIIAVWGQGGVYRKRDEAVEAMLAGQLKCFGCTSSGAPRHPLYLPSDTQLEEYV